MPLPHCHWVIRDSYIRISSIHLNFFSQLLNVNQIYHPWNMWRLWSSNVTRLPKPSTLCRHIKNDEHLVWEICSNCTQLLFCIAFRLILVILFCTVLHSSSKSCDLRDSLSYERTLDTLINSLKHFNSQITILWYIIKSINFYYSHQWIISSWSVIGLIMSHAIGWVISRGIM